MADTIDVDDGHRPTGDKLGTGSDHLYCPCEFTNNTHDKIKVIELTHTWKTETKTLLENQELDPGEPIDCDSIAHEFDNPRDHWRLKIERIGHTWSNDLLECNLGWADNGKTVNVSVDGSFLKIDPPVSRGCKAPMERRS